MEMQLFLKNIFLLNIKRSSNTRLSTFYNGRKRKALEAMRYEKLANIIELIQGFMKYLNNKTFSRKRPSLDGFIILNYDCLESQLMLDYILCLSSKTWIW